MRNRAIVGAWALLWAACGGTGQQTEEPDTTGAAGGEERAGAGGAETEPMGSEEEGGDAGETGAGKPSAIETLGISGPEEKAWDAMSADEKEFYMIGKVLPIMTEIFGQYEGQEESFEDVECETCHGDDMREVEFVMPSSELPAVPPVGTSEYTAMRDEHGDMVKFMEQTVTPTMAKLLGKDAYTCGGCHPDPG